MIISFESNDALLSAEMLSREDAGDVLKALVLTCSGKEYAFPRDQNGQPSAAAVLTFDRIRNEVLRRERKRAASANNGQLGGRPPGNEEPRQNPAEPSPNLAEPTANLEKPPGPVPVPVPAPVPAPAPAPNPVPSEKATESPVSGVFLAEYVQEAWKEFEAMRKKLKKPMTQNSRNRIRTKLEKLSGGDPIKAESILLQSVDNGWAGIYELREDKKRNSGKDDNAQFGKNWI